MKTIESKKIQVFEAGQISNEGIYSCKNCGQKIYLEKNKKLPVCPRCLSKFWTLSKKS